MCKVWEEPALRLTAERDALGPHRLAVSASRDFLGFGGLPKHSGGSLGIPSHPHNVTFCRTFLYCDLIWSCVKSKVSNLGEMTTSWG